MSIYNKSIGTKNESSLHRTLKIQYTGPGGKTEVETGEFVADGKRTDGEYIEVQTGSFKPLEKKVKEFTAGGRVRIIHPVAVTKMIETYKPGRRKKCGVLLRRNKSPKKGSSWNIFDALVYAPELPLVRGVTIEIVMVDITEKRIEDGKGARRRRGISIHDRELVSWHESIVLEKPADYLRFVPFKKKEEFTSSIFAERACIDHAMARKALYVLNKMNIVKRTGKDRNAWVYVRKK